MKSVVQILFADDTDFWHDLFRDLIQQEPLFEIVSVAWDGLTALQIAERVKPPVVVLDMNMPKLNGMETARRMRSIVPESKIIFLSGELDRDVVECALAVGVSGYVLKNDAARELLPAIHSVIRGEVFLSQGLQLRPCL